ncbi:spore protease YyaC [Bacillus norwichensis]|uniref:Spore protease YyaC n=1 Tax=Bacillus norwichensis TaxID=2762217 RepID=A0ABR8VHT2_9BACI|nr:spore protease YyaC [Bacillus norwichensis]MBD8004329.1 spore protease YyaC [Bacillus norwichensis]
MRILFGQRKKKTSNKMLSISVDGDGITTMADMISEILNISTSKDVIFLCVGSSRSIGDSLGPTVGTLLKEKEVPFHVLGTLDSPVHGLNLNSTMKKIQNEFTSPLVIPIDASLGDSSQVGKVHLINGPLIPGRATNKSLPPIGDYHLRAVVNELDPLMPVKSLNGAKAEVVEQLAMLITKVLSQVKVKNGTI